MTAGLTSTRSVNCIVFLHHGSQLGTAVHYSMVVGTVNKITTPSRPKSSIKQVDETSPWHNLTGLEGTVAMPPACWGIQRGQGGLSLRYCWFIMSTVLDRTAPGAEDTGLKEQSPASWFVAPKGLCSLSAGVQPRTGPQTWLLNINKPTVSLAGEARTRRGSGHAGGGSR